MSLSSARAVAVVLLLTVPGVMPASADSVSFPATPTLTLATGSESVAAGDLDGDFDIDIVVSPNFGAARYFLNDGTSARFSGAGLPLDITRTANDVALGDMNGDGLLDIVVGSFNEVEHLYLNNGTPDPFHQVVPTDIGSGPPDSTNEIYLVDLDHDGDLDVVAANTNQKGNKIYFNNGTAAPFAAVDHVFLSADRFYSEAMAFGDVDGDGYVDIVVANSDLLPDVDAALQLFLNNGSATPFANVTGDVLMASESVGSVAIGDVDGDADLDILAGVYGPAASLLLNNGTSAPFDGVQAQSVGETSEIRWRHVVTLADMNADTWPDLLVAAFSSITNDSQHRVILNNGSPQPFANRAGIAIGSSSQPTRSYAIADFDGDTDKDVLIGGLGAPDRLYAATIGPDTLPPQLMIQSPAAGSTLRDTVTVTATAIDDDGLDSVGFQVLNVDLGRRTAPPFEVQFDTTLVPNGAQSISAVARDRSGNEKLVSVVVTIANPINQAPSVAAGPDATIEAANMPMTLTGTVNDDGLPSNGALTTVWSQVSGPGTATFTNASSLSTHVGVSAPGTYVFRLTANDGSASATDDVTVTVNAPPAPPPVPQPAPSSGGGGGALGILELLLSIAILLRHRAPRPWRRARALWGARPAT